MPSKTRSTVLIRIMAGAGLLGASPLLGAARLADPEDRTSPEAVTRTLAGSYAPAEAPPETQVLMTVRLFRVNDMPAWVDGKAPKLTATRSAPQMPIMAEATAITRGTGGSGNTGVTWTTKAKTPVLLVSPQTDILIGDSVTFGLDDAKGEGIGPVEIVSAPRLLALAGQEAQVEIGQPIVYLAPDEEGCLRELQSGASEGLKVRLSARPDPEHDGSVRFDTFEMVLTEVVDREPVIGVTMDVGRPVVSTTTISASFSMSSEYAAIVPVFMMGEQASGLVAVLEAKVVEAEVVEGD